MAAPQGFTYERRGDGSVIICHHGSLSIVLRAERAEHFLTEVTAAGGTVAAQLVMSRWSGDYQPASEPPSRKNVRGR
ncbi:hypothetical protein [Streptomyces axinellae]|uniref:Uncharacterized protein n=1 Tax=Streptomyces axinellae TaxID=552788 RepID=A0ABP6CGV3_9ACTN